jgi:hypothetical protein
MSIFRKGNELALHLLDPTPHPVKMRHCTAALHQGASRESDLQHMRALKNALDPDRRQLRWTWADTLVAVPTQNLTSSPTDATDAK